MKNLSLSNLLPSKSSAALVVVLLAVVVLLYTYVGSRESDNALDIASTKLVRQTELRTGVLGRELSQLSNNALLLRDVPPTKGVMRAALNNGWDVQDSSTRAAWEKRLTEIFLAFSRANPAVTQVRLIGVANHGMELVRVDRRADRLMVVPDAQLQSKGNTQYFMETSKLQPGQVYLSDLNLNREKGQVERPFVPTIRAATPVYSEQGELFGMIVINYGIRGLLEEIRANIPVGTTLYLLNANGDFLLHPDPMQEFGFELGKNHRWQEQNSPIGDTPSLPDGVLHLRSVNGLAYAAVRRLALDRNDPKRYLELVLQQQESSIYSDVRRGQVTLAVAIAVVAALVIGVFFTLSRLRRRLFAEQAHLAAIVASTNDAIIGMTLSGVVTSWNHAAELLFGYTPQEAIGRTLLSLVVPPHLEHEEADVLRRIGRGESVPQFTTIRNRRDGSLVDVAVAVAPIRATDGRIIGAAKTVRDISEQKATEAMLQQSEARLRFAIDIAQIGLWERNLYDDTLFRSPRHDAIFGYPNLLPEWSEAIMLRHVVNEDRQGVAELLRNAHALGKDLTLECRIIRNDGVQRWVSIHERFYRDGIEPVNKLTGIIVDITEQRAAEQAILDANQLLEQQVRERTSQLAALSTLQRAILNDAAHAIIATDQQGLITVFNPAATRLLGYSADEMVGHATPAKFHLESEVLVRARQLSVELEQLIEPGFGVFVTKAALGLADENEWTYVCKDGSHVPVLLSVTALRNDAEAIIGYLGMALDITRRRRDTQALALLGEHFRKAADVAELGIWSWNVGDGRLNWNERMFQIYSAPEALRETGLYYEHWRAALHPDDVAPTEALLAAAVAGTATYDTVFRIMWPDGAIRYIQASAIREDNADGTAHQMLGINRDITIQFEHEQALSSAKVAADAASASKSAFLANMSHEIRTPMNAILGMLQLLQQTNLDSRQFDYADKARSAARSLLGILNDILDFSKVEAGKMTLDIQALNLDKLLRDIGVILSANVGGKEVEILFDIDPALPTWIMGDALRLQQILLNLAGNAIKFCTYGEIVVSAYRGDHDQEQATLDIQVRDTGIGIAPERCESIFEGFAQAEASTARRFGGTGLGLAISQRLVQMMGGELKVESQLGVGSTFSFSLACVAAPAPVQAPVEVVQLTELRVLLCDDNASARLVLNRIITSFGWRADLASSGAEALDLIQNSIDTGSEYDVVLIDWRMPDMDGWQTSLQIRRMIPQQKLPLIVMITAYGCELLAERQNESPTQLDGFLTKPVTASMLFDAVAAARAGRGVSNAPVSLRTEAQRRLEGVRLLLVEDNPTNQQVARELLRNDGALVTVAENGQSALDLLATATVPPYELVLMDIQMPGMDGYQATHAIRNRLGLRELPIVAMTANAMPSDREASLASGMNDHVGKPFDLAELIGVINRQLGRADMPMSVLSHDNGSIGKAVDCESLDVSTALRRFGGNHVAYRRALQGFMASGAELGQALSDAVFACEAGTIQNLLHTLKGLAGTIGADTLAALLADAESSWPHASDTTWPTIQDAIMQAREAAAATITMLTPSLAESQQPQAPSLLRGELAELTQLLKDANMGAVACFERLRSSLNTACPESVTELERALSMLNFPAASRICDDLANHLQ